MNQPIDNRGKIIECAVKLFSTKGYDAVGIQEIVDAAGITKPTLYHYFGSKKGLLEAIIDALGTPFIKAVKANTQYEFYVANTLNRIAMTWMREAQANPEFYRMQLAMYFTPEGNESHQSIMEWNMKLFQIVETVFITAAEDHGNMKGRHMAYASTFIGMLNTYIGMEMNGYCILTEELVSRAVHQYLHGIYS